MIFTMKIFDIIKRWFGFRREIAYKFDGEWVDVSEFNQIIILNNTKHNPTIVAGFSSDTIECRFIVLESKGDSKHLFAIVSKYFQINPIEGYTVVQDGPTFRVHPNPPRPHVKCVDRSDY